MEDPQLQEKLSEQFLSWAQQQGLDDELSPVVLKSAFSSSAEGVALVQNITEAAEVASAMLEEVRVRLTGYPGCCCRVQRRSA